MTLIIIIIITIIIIIIIIFYYNFNYYHYATLYFRAFGASFTTHLPKIPICKNSQFLSLRVEAIKFSVKEMTNRGKRTTHVAACIFK
jgi:hypothetical protein